MSFIGAYFYDKMMKGPEEACLIHWRKELLEQTDGKVLEIGSGTGASVELYPNKPSLELYLSEPDQNMRQRLTKKLRSLEKDNIKVLDSPAEKIDAKDDYFDYVFVSLVCCSVHSPQVALQEFKRVLKPSGKLIFMEHVAAEEGSNRRKWQDRLNFMWRSIAGNCHLNRETEKELIDAGFMIQTIKRESMRKVMAFVRPSIRGVATLKE